MRPRLFEAHRCRAHRREVVSASAGGRASCARLESTPLSGRLFIEPAHGATRGVRNSESERLARFVARGTETHLAGRSDWQWQRPRIVERHHETSSRRHPICSTERAFQLKLATSVIAHLFSEARSQERSFSKGRMLPRAARKSGSQDQLPPQRWLQEEPGSQESNRENVTLLQTTGLAAEKVFGDARSTVVL